MIEITRIGFFGACLLSGIAGALLMYAHMDIRRWLDVEAIVAAGGAQVLSLAMPHPLGQKEETMRKIRLVVDVPGMIRGQELEVVRRFGQGVFVRSDDGYLLGLFPTEYEDISDDQPDDQGVPDV